MTGRNRDFTRRVLALLTVLGMAISAFPAIPVIGAARGPGPNAPPVVVTDDPNDLLIPSGATYSTCGCLTYARSVQINGTLKVKPYDGSDPRTGMLWLEAPLIIIGPSGKILADGRGYGGGGGGQNDGGAAPGGKAGTGGFGGDGQQATWGRTYFANAGGGGGGSNGGKGGMGYQNGSDGTEAKGGDGGKSMGAVGGIGGTGFGAGGAGGGAFYAGGGGGGGGGSGGISSPSRNGGDGAGPYKGTGAMGTNDAPGAAQNAMNGGYMASESNGDTTTDISVVRGSGGGGGGTSDWYNYGGGGGGGGAGGGSVTLYSRGNMTISGAITTTGGGGGAGGGSYSTVGGHGGGGAGGGIALIALNLTISGALDARGRAQDTLSERNGGTVKLFTAANNTTTAAIRAGRLFRSDRPSMQDLSEPPQGGFASPRPVLGWENATDPENDTVTYEVVVAGDANFTDILFDKEGLSENSTRLPYSLAGAKYYWMVRASDAIGYGLWSAPGDFMVDDLAPSSQVAALPEYSNSTDIEVSWSGTDGQVAVASYGVFASDNNGEFREWMADTTWTCSTYSGQDGHSYRFYSIAADVFGNREAAPLQPDAATTVDTSPPQSQMVPLKPCQNTAKFTVEWDSTDAASGVRDYTVSVSRDGVNFSVWLNMVTDSSGDYTGEDGGAYTFYVQARDWVGNLEPAPGHEMRTATRVDLSAPTSNASFGAPSCGDAPVYIRPNGTVTLAAADNGSGVGATYYGLDFGTATKYSLPLQDFYVGSHNLSYWSVDPAGNEEMHRTVWFYADGDAPSTVLKLEGPNWTASGVTYLSNKTMLALSARDNGCGVDRILYSMGAAAPAVYNGSFAINSSAITNLKYWGVDKLGNEEAQKALAVAVDMTPPATTASVSIGAVGGLALVRLSASDSGSGLASTSYRITPPGGSAQSWQAGNEFSIVVKKDHSADGTYKIEYYSVDNVGNQEGVNSTQVVVDTVVSSSFTAGPNITVTKGNYTLTGRAEPGSSVLVNGQPAQVLQDGNFSFLVTLDKGANALVVTITDPAGNTKTDVRTVVYDKPAGVAASAGPDPLVLGLVALLVLMVVVIVVLLVRPRKPAPGATPPALPQAPSPLPVAPPPVEPPQPQAAPAVPPPVAPASAPPAAPMGSVPPPEEPEMRP